MKLGPSAIRVQSEFNGYPPVVLATPVQCLRANAYIASISSYSIIYQSHNPPASWSRGLPRNKKLSVCSYLLKTFCFIFFLRCTLSASPLSLSQFPPLRLVSVFSLGLITMAGQTDWTPASSTPALVTPSLFMTGRLINLPPLMGMVALNSSECRL